MQVATKDSTVNVVSPWYDDVLLVLPDTAAYNRNHNDGFRTGHEPPPLKKDYIRMMQLQTSEQQCELLDAPATLRRNNWAPNPKTLMSDESDFDDEDDDDFDDDDDDFDLEDSIDDDDDDDDDDFDDDDFDDEDDDDFDDEDDDVE